MSRTDYIASRLTTYFRRTLKCEIITLSKEQWAALPVPTAFRFGWMPPADIEAEGLAMICMFSPDLLAEVTAELDEAALDGYLVVVEAVALGHVSRRSAPTNEVLRHLEDLLFRESPDLYSLWNEVEATALDRGIVPLLT